MRSSPGRPRRTRSAYQRRWAATGIGYDAWWVDAGWYPCRAEDGQPRWTRTGTWKADPERFPHGLAPVSAASAEHGAELLLGSSRNG